MAVEDRQIEAELQLRQACIQMRRQLQAGQQARVEEFFVRFPALSSHADCAVELIYTELVAREEAGESPGLPEYLERFPQWGPLLERQFRLHQFLGEGLAEEPPRSVLAKADFEHLPLPRRAGNYELLEVIGRGSTGVVFRARDVRLERIVALKMFHGAGELTGDPLARFRLEAELVAQLSHPNIVQVFEAGDVEGVPFLALEHLGGGSLADVPARLGLRDAAQMTCVLATAMQCAHERGIIHRDLKPGNVLRAQDGVLKITDFGLAKQLNSTRRTKTGAVLGTPCYMPPEQAGGDLQAVGTRSDVYSLGAILYFLLTSQPPVSGEAGLAAVLHGEFQTPVSPRTLRPEIDQDLEAICLVCLQKDPARRYPSAQDLADDLQRYLDGDCVRARPVGVIEAGRRWMWRRPALAGLLLTIVVLLTALTAGAAWHVAQLRKSYQQIEGLTAKTQAQNRSLAAQLDQLQRGVFASQVHQAQQLARQEPLAALALLDDPDRCPESLRDFAWRHWHTVADQSGWEIHAHQGPVLAVASSGELLATGGEDRMVRIWEAAAGRSISEFRGHKGPVLAVAFVNHLQDGRPCVASASADGSVRLWSLDRAEPLWVLEGHMGAVHCVAAAPNGALVASGGEDQRVRIWDVATGEQMATLEGHASAVFGLDFSPSGRELVSCGPDRAVIVWNVAERRRLAVQQRADKPTYCAVFSPDGLRVASGRQSGLSVAVWEWQGTRRPQQFADHIEVVRNLAFTPDGNRLLACGQRSLLTLWDLNDNRSVLTLRRPACCAALLADGRAFVGGDAEGKLWTWRFTDLAEDGPLAAALAQAREAIFSADGRTLALTSWRRLQLWDWPSRTLRGQLEHDARLLGLAADGQRAYFTAQDGVAIRRLPTGEEVQNLRFGTGRVATLAELPGTDRMAYSWALPLVLLEGRLADLPRRHASLHTRAANVMACSSDGRLLATGSDQGSIELWDAQTWKRLGFWEAHAGGVDCLAFDPQGGCLVSGGRDRAARIWDLSTLQQRAVVSDFADPVMSVAISPDGRTLAAASGSQATRSKSELRLCDPRSGQVRSILSEVGAPATFSPNGESLFVGAKQGLIELRGALPATAN